MGSVKKKSIRTVTLMLVIVSNHVCAITNPVYISPNTSPIQRKLAVGANNTIVRRATRTSLTAWRARCTRLPTTEAAVRTNGATRSGLLDRITVRRVISILGEPTPARFAVACTVRALLAAKLAN
jgi:hypothetical protein